MSSLPTEADLAKLLGISEEQAACLRRRRRWEHIRVSRNEVRYTETQIAAIIASMTTRDRPREPKPQAPASGRTARSRARAS